MRGNTDFNYEAEISKTAGAIHRELTNKLNKIFSKGKLTMSHIIILELLYERKHSTMTELAKSLNLTMSAATAIIDKMVELRFVDRARSNKDRRIVEVSLTKKGATAATKVLSNRLEMVKEMFFILTKPEKQQYLLLLRKVYSGIRERE